MTRDCPAWHDRYGECARLGAPGHREHATSTPEGRLVTWTDDDEEAHRA